VVSSLLITAVGAGMCWTALKEAAWIR